MSSYLEGAGISRKELAKIVGKDAADKMFSMGDSISMALADDLGICDNCLQAGWLMVVSGGIIKCQNCGEEWIVLEGK